MKEKDKRSKLQVVLLILAGVAIVGGIIFMKTAADRPVASDADGQQTHTKAVAIPDTSTHATDMQLPSETISVAMPDTIGKDKRPAYEAGYEDGYLSGIDDGSQGAERATYDESNTFPTTAEQSSYVRGYREGYAKGFEDGENGKQFNI